MDPTRGLVTDSRSLDRLKLEASRDPKAAVRQAAGQFEALFMQMVLKSMRDAMPKSDLMGGHGQEMYTSMLDQQLSQSLSGRPGGLGEVIARQLTSRMGGGTPTTGGLSALGADAGASDAGSAEDAIGAATMGQARLAAMLRKAAQERAAGATVPSAPVDASKTSPAQADFVRRMWPHAAQAEQQTGVPAAFVVGQAALESGWGKGEIRRPDGSTSFNLFGIKAGAGWKGATVDVTTTEYVDGQPRKQVERFRAYGSYAEAFRDWSSLMAGQSRYGQVMRAAGTVDGYAQGMQKAGYATDPAYGSKLERTINQTIAIRRMVV